MKKDIYDKEMKNSNQNQSFGRMSARFANKDRPDNVKNTLRRLLNHSKSESKIYLVVLILVMFISSLNLYAPRLIGNVIDQLNEGLFGEVGLSLTILALVYTALSLFSWLSEFLIAGASQRIIKTLREELFEKLSRLPIEYFDTHSHGDIMSRFTNDIDNVSAVFTQSTTALLRSIIMVIGSLTIMMYLNLTMALGVMISVPLVYGLSKLIASKTIRYFEKSAEFTGEINGLVEETVYGLNIVQSFNKETQFAQTFEESNKELFHYSRKAQMWTGLLMPLLNVIKNLTFAVIGLIGGYLVIKGDITIGVVASFIAYSRHFVRPLNELASIYNALMGAIAGSQRVFQVLDEVEETEHEHATDDFDVAGKVTFENVGFHYIKGVEVIKDLDLNIKPGMKVAIVGPTGAGKTTIVNLITRFYTPQKGTISIDDTPIELLNRHKLRQNIGFVLQDTYLFSGTIYENIQYGKLDATKDEIIEAATIAKAHDFIHKLPHKYETRLTFGGMNLSQGERQLITIARALLLNPKLLILDEATSSVDIITEKLISDSLLALMENRTSFIIAHRLSTIIKADLILVLNEGELIEYGTHSELLEQEGFYNEMYEIQNLS
jgi:ATP-binding cassette subfamily B protein